METSYGKAIHIFRQLRHSSDACEGYDVTSLSGDGGIYRRRRRMLMLRAQQRLGND